MSSLVTDNKAPTPGRNTTQHGERPAWEPAPYPPWGTAKSKGNGQFKYEDDKKLVEFCKSQKPPRLPKYETEIYLYRRWNRAQKGYYEAHKTGDEEHINAFERLERWIAGACGKENINELLETRTKNKREKMREEMKKYVPKKLTTEMANMSLDTKPPAEVEDKALQKYYTTAARIAKCIVTIREKLNINEDDVIIEPSAGDGRWVPYLKTLCKNVEAYDIKPDVPEVKKMDFLEYVAPEEKKGKIHVIGNPPFHGVEEKFIKKCVGFAASVSFILPAKYIKRDNLELYYEADGVTKHKDIYHLPLEFHPVYTEYMEKEKFDGTPNLQPVAFIIWERRSVHRPTIPMPKGEFYEYVEYSKRSSANVKIQLKDGYCWSYDKTQERAYNDNMDRHYYLKINTSLISVKAFAEEYNKLDLKKMYPERSYCRNKLHCRISKFDLFTALKEFWDNLVEDKKVPAAADSEDEEESEEEEVVIPDGCKCYREYLKGPKTNRRTWIQNGKRPGKGMIPLDVWAYLRSVKDEKPAAGPYAYNPELKAEARWAAVENLLGKDVVELLKKLKNIEEGDEEAREDFLYEFEEWECEVEITNEEECRIMAPVFKLTDTFQFGDVKFTNLTDKCYKILSPSLIGLWARSFRIDGITDEGMKHLAKTLSGCSHHVTINSEELSEEGWSEFINALTDDNGYKCEMSLNILGNGITDKTCYSLAAAYNVNKFDPPFINGSSNFDISSKNIGPEGQKILKGINRDWERGEIDYVFDDEAVVAEEDKKVSAKVPAEVPITPAVVEVPVAPAFVTAEDIERFKQGGYTKENYRKWEDGKEPPEGRKWVDEYFATTNSKDLFGECGYKTPPVTTGERPNLYRRTYLKK